MYYITGDTHRDFKNIIFYTYIKNTTKDDVFIILGDAGINYFLDDRDYELKKQLSKLPVTLFCIKGNHEKYPETIGSYKIKEWNGAKVFYEEEFPNLLFAKDGEIYNIENKKVLTIGGAYSVDKFYRIVKNIGWFEDEQPSEEVKRYTEENLEKNNWKVDIVLSHTCPEKTMPTHLFMQGLDQSKVDHSTEKWLDKISDKLEFKRWYFGHFHGVWENGKFELMFNNMKNFP